MCFKAPKPPKVTDPVADPSLTRQRMQAELDLAQQKADQKQTRTEQQLAVLAGRLGRKSLFSGGQGGVGFGSIYSIKSLMNANGEVPQAPQVQPPQPVVTDVGGGIDAFGVGGGGIREFVGAGDYFGGAVSTSRSLFSKTGAM